MITGVWDTGICEKNTPFRRALALQSSVGNCSPAPDLALTRLVFLSMFFSRGVFFHRHRYGMI